MKQQGSNNRRSRSRGGGKRSSGGGGGGGRNSFESNGPDVKIRGSAQQVQEKYLTLARDASSSGDWVSAEAYYQYAEHYHRISNTDGGKGQGQGQSQGQKQNQGGGNTKTQEPRVAQNASSGSDKKADKGEAEVIDTSPAALAAAVAGRESQEADAPKAAKAPAKAPVEAVVEAATETEPETAPEKAAS
jgi:hypothetical protein